MIIDSETNARFAGSVGYITDENAGGESESGLLDRARSAFGLENGGEDTRVSTVEMRNLFHEEDPMEAAREMQITANARKKVEYPVYSISLSYHPRDNPTDREMVEDMDAFLERRGLVEHQAVLAVHRDKRHPHIHATVNRVHPSAEKTWERSFDYYQNMKVCRELERERGWVQVERDEEAGRIADWKHRRRNQTGKIPFGQVVRLRAEEVFAESESWKELRRRLAGYGLQVVKAGSGGRVTDGEESAPLSEVARKWSFNRLDAKYPDRFETHERTGVEPERTEVESDQKRGVSGEGEVLRHEPTGETVKLSNVGEGHELTELESQFGERYADYLERREEMGQRLDGQPSGGQPSGGEPSGGEPSGGEPSGGEQSEGRGQREGPARAAEGSGRGGEAEGQPARSDREEGPGAGERDRELEGSGPAVSQKAQQGDGEAGGDPEDSERDRRRAGRDAEGGEAALEDHPRARERPGGGRGVEKAAPGGGQDDEEDSPLGGSGRRSDRGTDQRDPDRVGDEQPLGEDSESLELPGVDPEEAEPLDGSDVEPFDPREVGVASEEELPGEPIDPSLPENEMRQEARRWVGRDLGRSLSAEMTEEGEALVTDGKDPIEEGLRSAETRELKRRMYKISRHKREAYYRRSDLPTPGEDVPEKKVPETVEQKRRALTDEREAAEAYIDQIQEEINRRPTEAEAKIRSALMEAKDLGRVLERGTVKEGVMGKEKPLTERRAREKRVERARALDRAEGRLRSLGPEERREICRRIEENRPGLAEVLEEAEDPSRQSADQMEKKQARRRRGRHASRARGRVEDHLARARRAEERGQKARKHEALDAAEKEIEELSLGTDMTEREAEKAVAEGLSREERSLLGEATDPGRPSADEIRGKGGQGKSSSQGEGSGQGEGSSENRSQDEIEDRGRGWEQDRGPSL